MTQFWPFIASPGASLLASLLALVLLFRLGRHRDPAGGAVSHQRISGAVILPAAAYTMLICILGQFFMGIAISETLATGFGNDRMGWLLIFLFADVLGRILGLYK